MVIVFARGDRRFGVILRALRVDLALEIKKTDHICQEFSGRALYIPLR
jgi:hypothetical protein